MINKGSFSDASHETHELMTQAAESGLCVSHINPERCPESRLRFMPAGERELLISKEFGCRLGILTARHIGVGDASETLQRLAERLGVHI